jgi:acetaldehyde dehydrogenase (acetylating)
MFSMVHARGMTKGHLIGPAVLPNDNVRQHRDQRFANVATTGA